MSSKLRPVDPGEASANARNAGRYRQRAEELRTIAGDWISDDARAALYKVARDYERMATTLERMDYSSQEIEKLDRVR
jgi:hypothetical protein